ncbi:MAG: uroporphyrinogen decarboxylase [Planctomycetota bacterium]
MSVFLDTLEGRKVSRRPLWIMRQAGRYLPQYKATRAKAGNFLALCGNPTLAAEVTCQPVELLGVDAAILFSDILLVPQAMGFELKFGEGEGPSFPVTLDPSKPRWAGDRTFAQGFMPESVSSKLPHVYEAIRLCRARLGATPLIGFAGSPWTLFAYLAQGRHEEGFPRAKQLLWQEPAFSKDVLEVLTDAVIEHLSAQARAGVQCVQVFDSWGGLLDRADFRQWSAPYLSRVAMALEELGVPVIMYCKGGEGAFEDLLPNPARCLGVDWTVDMGRARSKAGPRRILMGNVDPLVLTMDEGTARRKLRECLQAHGREGGHILNLGHGITPEASPELVKKFVLWAREEGERLMQNSQGA